MTRWQRARPALGWILVGAFLAFAVVRVFGLEYGWPLRMLMSFTPYIAVAAVIPLLVTAIGRQWRAAGLAVLTGLALVTVLVPRAIGEPDPGHGPRLMVMSSNMKLGAADPAEIVALVRSHHVDLLALEEFTPDAEDHLAAAGLTALLPFSATNPVTGALGAAIYSRYPLTNARNVTVAGGFGQEDATVLVPGAPPLFFEAVHARAPVFPSATTDWIRSLGEQAHATPHGTVRLLAGDFNATLDHAPLRSLLATGYHDVASQLGDGLVTTWPYDGRWIPPVTIDHMFADPRIGAISFGATDVTGTDHRAIWAELTLPAT